MHKIYRPKLDKAYLVFDHGYSINCLKSPDVKYPGHIKAQAAYQVRFSTFQNSIIWVGRRKLSLNEEYLVYTKNILHSEQV